jgi:Uma2 family endonuclease
MTVAEFLSWDNGDWSGRRWQLINGDPVAMDPAGETHGALVAEIARLLGNHLLERRSSCRILVEPGIIPRADSVRNFRIPDLGVTCSPAAAGQVVPEPTLLIEVLSPSNAASTRANFWAYTTIPTVQEILIVHSTRLEAELLRRGADGVWPEAPAVIHPPAALELASIGLSAPLEALYRTTGLI